MQLWTGTSGYSYKEWKGIFYPKKLPASEMLRFYCQHFPTVEINNTFYRMPDEAMLSRWASEAPANFAFSLKAPRRITHEKRLREAEPDLAEFVRRTSTLGDKLAVILFQLPPFLKKDLAALQNFLGLLPDTRSAAFEFRNRSWCDDSVYEALHAHGAMFCVADTETGDTPVVSTASCGYLRLRRTDYDDQALSAWAERIAAQSWSGAYVYFKHEDEALGPRFAERFIQLWGAMHGSG